MKQIKQCWAALCIALSTYSRIPAPQVAWNDDNRRYAMCFFPLVGVLVGAALWGWLLLCRLAGFGGLLQGAVGTALPLLITGGIHMDGFMDTTDAMASWKSPEERLAILKDSHVGAFAVMGCGMYLLCMAGVLSEAGTVPAVCLMACFAASRSLSALNLMWMKNARPQSMLPTFAQQRQKRVCTAVCALWLCSCAAVLLLFGGPGGALSIAGAALCVLAYRRRAYKYFGGVTGDLAGWFLQVTELVLLSCIVLGRYLA